MQISNNIIKPVSFDKLTQTIGGSNLTLEDVFMPYLYWQQSEVVREETVNLIKCKVIRLEAPDNHSNYSIVYVWIHEKSGLPMQIVGYNAEGKPLKQLRVSRLGSWFSKNPASIYAKEIIVKSIDPEANKVAGEVVTLQWSKPQYQL